jgi:hypothetical protein
MLPCLVVELKSAGGSLAHSARICQHQYHGNAKKGEVLKICWCSLVILFTLSMAADGFADAPDVPDSTPLTEAEIKGLLTGRTFEFIAYDEPLTGTTNWDFERGAVSGDYIWNGSEEGEFDTEMFIDEQNRLCVVNKKGTNCQIVYRYENGFMEVTPEGIVHAVSKPIE